MELYNSLKSNKQVKLLDWKLQCMAISRAAARAQNQLKHATIQREQERGREKTINS